MIAVKSGGGVYELLAQQFRQNERKEYFIERCRFAVEELGSAELIDFIPHSATLLAPDWWWISGCGTFREQGTLKRVDSVVEAYLENGEWRFSQIRMNLPLHGLARPCKNTK